MQGNGGELNRPAQIGDVQIRYDVHFLDRSTMESPSLTIITLKQREDHGYFRLREKFPGVYPPLEVDLEACKVLYRYVQPLYAELTQIAANNGPPQAIPFNVLTGAWQKAERIMGSISRLNLGSAVQEINSSLIYKDYRDEDIGEGWIGFMIKVDKYLARRFESFPEVWKRIVAHYESYGYRWRYFLFYNDSHALARVFNGEIPLRPDTFEMGTTLSELLQYENNLEELDGANWHRINANDDASVWSRHNIGPFLGWRKDALVKAIQDSGLVREPLPPNETLYIDMMVIKRKDLGLRTENYPLGNPKWRDPHTEFRVLRGFDLARAGDEIDRLNHNQAYYLTLYRRIYATLDSLKWDVICSNDIIPLDKLRFLAEQHVGSKFDDQDMKSICSVVLDATAKRKALMEQLKEDLPFQVDAVKFQPNTPWLQPISQLRYRDAGQAITKPYEQFVFIKALCANDEIDAEGMRLKLNQARMMHLVPGGYENATKEQLCEYLIETMGYQAEKFENILFDCSDPAIRKRHIINTLNIMELGGIFKDVDLEKATKEDLCRIVTNFIYTTMEQRALTLASPSSLRSNNAVANAPAVRH